MSMHQSIDLSRFKKVASDEKTSTLRHSKGHEIKIAHKALTPKMRDQLDKLPVHLAEGGSPNEDIDIAKAVFSSAPVTPKEETSPISQDLSANRATPQELDALKSNLLAQQTPMPTMEEAPAAEIPQEVAPAPPAEQMPAQSPASIGTPVQAPAPPTVDQQLKSEDANIQMDLDAGHIKPDTYHDLFAKKDTMGKIGTIFGLLVGGAGAGLSRQPNALLEMMNKEIERDLEAQKSSASNKQNLYKLNLEHQMNTAQIAQMQKQGLLTDAQVKMMTLEAKIKADALTQMQANRFALNSLVKKVEKLPIGSPMRAQAEQQLAMLSQGVQNENFNLADRAAAAAAMANLTFGNQGHADGGDDESSFQNRQNMLRRLGSKDLADANEQKHVPGIKGQASIPLTPDDRKAIRSGVEFQGQLQRMIDWTKKHSGETDPAEIAKGQALAGQLLSAYQNAHAGGGVYKEGEADFIGKMIDPDPTKFFNKIRVLPKLEAVKSETLHGLNGHLKSLGFKGYEGTPSEKSEAPTTMTSKSGRPMIQKDGKWYYTKASH